MFNGDPHPGNYKFHHDGSITFLDYGLVKRWTPGEWESLSPTLEAIVVNRDPDQLIAAMETAGFLRRGHGLDAEHVFNYVSSPYMPYLTDEFTFSREWMRDTLSVIFDIQGPHARVIEQLNMPPSFVILDRVVWGVSAILGKLEARGTVAGDAARVHRRRRAGHRARRRRGRLASRPLPRLTPAVCVTATGEVRRIL